MANTATTKPTERYVIFRNFLNEEEQIKLSKCVMKSHNDNTDTNNSNGNDKPSSSSPFDWNSVLYNSTSSFKLEIGLSHHNKSSSSSSNCGGDISQSLPFSVQLARKVFQKASIHYYNNNNNNIIQSLEKLASSKTNLTGLCLLYGPNSFMKSHYDSPTQYGKREEWLCMFTVGQDVSFRLNSKCEVLKSGDALVMDSMAVLHGVDKIILSSNNNNNNDDSVFVNYGLPVNDCRLGVLLWQASDQQNIIRKETLDEIENDDNNESMISDLFIHGSDSSSENDEN